MKVLVIPEDFRKDQYILKPLFKQLLRSMGRPNARVRVCTDPLLGGIGEAMKVKRIAEIMERYGTMIDLFILCVDRDGNLGRRQRLDEIEIEFNQIDGHFLAENAWEELETWALAGLDLPHHWRWRVIREEKTSRRITSTNLPDFVVSTTDPAVAARHWAERPHRESTRSGRSVVRISTLLQDVLKPLRAEDERAPG